MPVSDPEPPHDVHRCRRRHADHDRGWLIKLSADDQEHAARDVVAYTFHDGGIGREHGEAPLSKMLERFDAFCLRHGGVAGTA